MRSGQVAAGDKWKEKDDSEHKGSLHFPKTSRLCVGARLWHDSWTDAR